MRLLLSFLILSSVTLFAQEDNIVKLRTISPAGDADESIVRLYPEATAAYDAMWDAWKLFYGNPDVPVLYSHSSEGWEMSVNSIPFPTKDTAMYITMDAETMSGEYLLELEFEGVFDAGYRVGLQLIDSGQKFVIDSNTSILFNVTASTVSTPRFLFVISPKPLFFADEQAAKIINSGAANWNCQLFNMSGALLSIQTSPNDTAVFHNLADGDYYAISTDDFGFADTTWFTMNSGNAGENPETTETGVFMTLDENTGSTPYIIYENGRTYLVAKQINDEGVRIETYSFSGQQLSSIHSGPGAYLPVELEQRNEPYLVVCYTTGKKFTFKIMP